MRKLKCGADVDLADRDKSTSIKIALKSIIFLMDHVALHRFPHAVFSGKF